MVQVSKVFTKDISANSIYWFPVFERLIFQPLFLFLYYEKIGIVFIGGVDDGCIVFH